MEFLDVPGERADSYRLRIWPDGGGHAPVAGNFVIARLNSGEVAIVAIGVTTNLARLRGSVANLTLGERLYTRLEVGRVAREAINTDLVGRYPNAEVQTTHP